MIKYFLFKKPKYLVQRAIRGFSDEDVWNAYYFFAEIIVKVLSQLKKFNNSYPARLKNFKEWSKVLDKIITGFKLILENEDRILTLNIEEAKKVYKKLSKDERKYWLSIRELKKIERAFNLFKEYFLDFWD